MWSEFSFYRSFNRTQHTKKFTVPFTRIGIDNKSVSVCVPAIVYACAHMPVCVCVCVCVYEQPLPCKCACETAVYLRGTAAGV